jgi:hypothetical protein
LHQQVKLKFGQQDTLKHLMQNIAKITQKVKQRGNSTEIKTSQTITSDQPAQKVPEEQT